MKRALLIFGMLYSAMVGAQSEVNVTLVITPPYSPYLSDYTEFGGQNILQLTNTTASSVQLKLIGQIEGLDNGISVFTDIDYQPAAPITLAPFQTLFVTGATQSMDFLDANHVTSNLSSEQEYSLFTSGILPEGMYTICIRALDYNTGTPLSLDAPSGCTTITIAYPTPPILINPICSTAINTNLPVFTWTPVISSGSFFFYDLYVIELITGQVPEDAMYLAIETGLGNPVIIRNLATTIYNYKPFDVPLVAGKTYAWCVVARDANNFINIVNEGRSEVCLFDYELPYIPPIMELEPELVTDNIFSLNNSSVSGQILYRFHSNENFGEPAAPLYNPTLTVYDIPKSAEEIALMQPQGGSGYEFNAMGNDDVFMYDAGNAMGLVGGKIEIDPTVQYLYHNTLSIAGAEPLRNTSVSIYLEYVAIVKDMMGTEYYFQVLPGTEMYYNAVGVNQHGNPLDPQLAYAASQANLDVNYAMSLRPLGSELLGTTSTDENGNFNFNFDMTENTGLLNSGPLNLLTWYFNPPDDIYDENIWVNPLDEVANPWDQLFNPFDEVMNDPYDALFGGNMFMQDNGGWNAAGAGTEVFNADFNFGNTFNNLFNTDGLNQNFNQNVKQFSPAPGPAPFDPPAPSPWELLTYQNYTVTNVFKVLRIKVNDTKFVSPDVLVFVQPGDHVSLPPVTTFVHSYDAIVSFTAGGKAGDDPLLAPGVPMSNVNVRMGHLKSWWNIRPDNFPVGEGMNISPEEVFSIGSATPYYYGWNQDAAKPGQIRLTSELPTTAAGKATFSRLVSNINYTDNIFYFEAQNALTGTYNYSGSWGSFSQRSYLPTTMNEAVHSWNFRPDTLTRDVALLPMDPELLLRTVTVSNIETAPLEGVDVYMLKYNKNGSTYTYSNFEMGETDAEGYQRFTNMEMSYGPSGLENPYRRIMLTKWGYTTKYLPVDVATATNDAHYLQPAKLGQRLDLGEVVMSGNSNVYGYVKDDLDRPVTALVKVGDGAWYMTGLTSNDTNFDSPVISSVPVEHPPVYFSLGLGDVAEANQYLIGNKFVSEDVIDFDFQASNDLDLTYSVGGYDLVHEYPGFELFDNGILDQILAQKSKFSMNAGGTGSNTRVIIIPMSDQYIADTFYVNIPYNVTDYNIGTFVVFEKAHRVKVQVKGANDSRMFGALPIAGASVEVGDYGGTTNIDGYAWFRFTTPDSYFRMYLQANGFVPYENYEYIPISKSYQLHQYTLDQGMTVSGKITDAVTGNPIQNARVYVATGFTFYGATDVETFTDANGNYVLQGVPRESIDILAAVSGSDPSYIGGAYNVLFPGPTITGANMALQPISDMDLSTLYGFPVEIDTYVPQAGGHAIISGAFVNLPSNGNFSLIDENARVRFTGVEVSPDGPPGLGGRPVAVPVGFEVSTMELMMRVRVHDAFVADVFSHKSGWFPTIALYPVGGGGGTLKGKVNMDLESFKFSYDYTGAFFLGETSSSATVSVFASDAATSPNRSYYLMDLKYGVPSDISFSIHNFDAKADRSNSKLSNDSVLISTILYPNLPLADAVEVDAGTITVTPLSIVIGNPGEEISFGLENWTVKSDGGWSYSIPLGGIVIPDASIQTQLVDIPITDLILRPTELIMEAANVDLGNMMVGGNVTKLYQYAGSEAVFNFDPACSWDLAPHWRFSLYGQDDGPSSYIKGLPGFVSTQHIDFGSFTLYSNNSTYIQPVTQVLPFHNIANISLQNVSSGVDGLELTGAFYLDIPNMTTPTIILEYVKPSNTILRNVKSLDIGLQNPGKVYFDGYLGTENYVISENYFSASGKLTFEDDNINDNNKIELKGKLVKDLSGIVLSIPKLQENSSDAAYQYISMDGGSSSKLKILQGNQKVVGGSWNTMWFDADMVGVVGMGNDKTLKYLVSGAVEADPDPGNQLEVEDIQTPFGGLTLVFDWQKGSFLGTLTIDVPIVIYSFQLNSGLFELYVDGSGFYFDVIGNVSLPGLEWLDANVGFLTGYYPDLPDQVINRHQDIMYLASVPDYLKNDGIGGIYFNANVAPSIANWSTSIDLLVFSIGMGVNAGADMNYLLNFGPTTVMTLEAAAYAKAWAGVDVLVCSLCIGAMAQFIVEGTLQLTPSVEASLGACASFTMFGDFCGTSMEESIGCDVQYSTDTGFDFDMQWSPCGGTANKLNTSCDF